MVDSADSTPHPKRAAALERIRLNIEKFGSHLYSVSGGGTPRFVYSIGPSQSLGAELVLAGAASFTANEAFAILNDVVEQLREGARWTEDFDVESHGRFRLASVHDSWSSMMLLGALDYFGVRSVTTYQVIPEGIHRTKEIPDMSRPFDPAREPVWRWLRDPWSLPFPQEGRAVTTLAALRGEAVTEAARWEEDYWELYVGGPPDKGDPDVRSVHLAVLLGVDPSLRAVSELAVGSALWREDADDEWHVWTKK
jgi:hypothetical protein